MVADCLVRSTELDTCAPGESTKALQASTLTLSPLTTQNCNHATALSSSPFYRAGLQHSQVDDFGSPSISRSYPISPNMSEYLRTRREQFFLNPQNGNRTRSRRAQDQNDEQSSTPIRTGPSRRTGPHVNPFANAASASTDVDQNASSRLMRQQFRQRCQAAMERDRQRDRQRRLQGVRSVVEQSSSPSRGRLTGTQDGDISFSEVDASSSDVDTATWDDEEDEEMIRRIMTAEYRRLLREQERQGEREVGWLDPDEVAWLQEEMRREEALGIDVQPPPELEDEDEVLCAMFEHANRHATSSAVKNGSTSTTDLEDDFSWVQDVDLDYDMVDDVTASDG